MNSDGTPMAAGDLTAGGTKGPGGDNYRYAHAQLDAQAVMRVSNSLSMIVYGLNLNNEVFGFYNASPQYVVQREFYKPTFAVGFRLTPKSKSSRRHTMSRRDLSVPPASRLPTLIPIDRGVLAAPTSVDGADKTESSRIHPRSGTITISPRP